jgi:outer membrane translocation and assembly module TamA
LPDDVLVWLKTLHNDPAWAIVKLHEQAVRRRRPVALAELVQLPERRALIMVNAQVLSHIPGVAVIPMSDGRGLLALDPGRGVADLELAVIDRLDATRLAPTEREALTALRDRLREWRQQGVVFESRAIIVATRDSRQQANRSSSATARANGSRDVA